MFLFLFLFFLYAVTMLIFQIKRIISSEKWFNYVVTFFFSKMPKKLGRSDDGKRRKKKDGLRRDKRAPLTRRFICLRRRRSEPSVYIYEYVGRLQLRLKFVRLQAFQREITTIYQRHGNG